MYKKGETMKNNSLKVDTDYILQQIKLAMSKIVDIDYYNMSSITRTRNQKRLNEAYFILDNLKTRLQKEKK